MVSVQGEQYKNLHVTAKMAGKKCTNSEQTKWLDQKGKDQKISWNINRIMIYKDLDM